MDVRVGLWRKLSSRRIDAFELWCWRRLLRVPWTSRRPNQSILREISPGCSLEGLMLQLKRQYLGPPHAKSWLIGKDSDTGRDWGQEEKGMTEDEMAGWHHQLDGREFGWTPGVGDHREAWHAAVHGVAKSQTRLSDWTELNWASLSSSWKPQSYFWFFLLNKSLTSSISLKPSLYFA